MRIYIIANDGIMLCREVPRVRALPAGEPIGRCRASCIGDGSWGIVSCMSGMSWPALFCLEGPMVSWQGPPGGSAIRRAAGSPNSFWYNTKVASSPGSFRHV
jgi:hypothetical protein